MTREGYECYKLYLALQRHFSTDYDFHKYNGKVNASVDAYNKRNDKFSFEKLSKIIEVDERVDFFICHFLENPKCWIRDMSKQSYENYKAHLRLFPKTFKSDLEFISMHNPVDLMKTGNDIPLIHQMAINKKICLETIITMDYFFPFVDKHEKEVSIPFVFPEHIKRIKKYRPFLINKISDVHKDIMKSVLLNNESR